jgi:hypothetical protein
MQAWMAVILSGYATNQVRAKIIQSIKLGGLNKITVCFGYGNVPN